MQKLLYDELKPHFNKSQSFKNYFAFMNFSAKKIIFSGFVIVVILTFFSFLATIWLNMTQAFTMVFGTFFVLFVPGYFWTFVIFHGIKPLERITTSIALSITFVPLTMFAANKLGFRPSPLSIIIEIIIIALIAILVLFIKKSVKQ